MNSGSPGGFQSIFRRFSPVVLGIWIFGTGFFYFFRFSFEFYYANRGAIDAALK